MVDSQFIRKPLRDGDSFIMDVVLASNKFNDHQLQCVNAVRMFMGVTFVSEMSNCAGTHMHLKQKDFEFQPNHTALNQPQPGRKSFKLWSQVQKLFAADSNGRLAKPLGKWLPTHSHHGTWNAYRVGRTIHCRTHTSWQTYRMHGSTLKFDHTNVAFTPSATMTPVSVRRLANGILIITSNSTVQPMDSIYPPSDWPEFIAAKPQWIQEIINNSTFDDIPSVMA